MYWSFGVTPVSRFKFWKYGLSFKISENKYVEVEVWKDSSVINYFDFVFRWSRKGDHAGIVFSVGLLRNCFSSTFYDSRHWNWDENRWYEEDEEAFEFYTEGTYTAEQFERAVGYPPSKSKFYKEKKS